MQYRPYHCRRLFVTYIQPYFIHTFLYPRSVWPCFSPTINTVLKLVIFSWDRSVICNSLSSSILCGYDGSVDTDRRLKCKLVRVNTTSPGTNRNYSIVTDGCILRLRRRGGAMVARKEAIDNPIAPKTGNVWSATAATMCSSTHRVPPTNPAAPQLKQ